MLARDPSSYSPDRSYPAKLKRRLTQWRTAKPLGALPARAIVTFTFDDFPKSAAEYGADALAAYDASATFYACSGMAGTSNLTGALFTSQDLAALVAAGHEIGAHTHNHLDCASAPVAAIRAEIETNLAALKRMAPAIPVGQFAWPYGETHWRAKAGITDLTGSARGILPGINRKGTDLMQLRAYELSPDDWTTKRAATAIETAARSGGWVIIFSHDVRARPSPFGTTPAVISQLARRARDAGADLLSVSGALSRIAPQAGS